MRIVLFKPEGVAAPYVIGDLAEALEELGHDVLVIKVAQIQEERVNELVDKLASFRPDFAVFYGIGGFIQIQRGPRPTDLLTELDLPYAALICDNPYLVLESLVRARSPLMHLFVWDDFYAEHLREQGFTKVYPFSLATNGRRFATRLSSDGNSHVYKSTNLALVGSLAPKNHLDALQQQVGADTLLHTINRLRRQNPQYSVHEALMNLAAQLDPESADTVRRLLSTPLGSTFAYASDQLITREKRAAIARLLEQKGLKVWGSQAWTEVLTLEDTYQGPIDYEGELSSLYRNATIIVDVPSAQLVTAVNQRVFDVPAAGGFILTEYRTGLEKLFHVGREIVAYRNESELEHLVDYFLAHPGERRRIAEAGRQRVLAEHTYHHRAEYLVSVMEPAVRERRARATAVVSAHAHSIACNLCGSSNAIPLYTWQFVHRGAEIPFSLVTCTDCGLVYNNPQWHPDILKDFYTYRYHGPSPPSDTAEKMLTIAVPYAERVLDLIEEVRSGGVLLDVGAGKGALAAVAATRGWRAYAVEPYEAPVAEARKLFGWTGANYAIGDLDSLTHVEEPVDCIVFNDVLEHLHDPAGSLRKAWQLLAAGGIVVVSLPDASSIYAKWLGKGWRHWDPPYHLYGFGRKTLGLLLETSGFRPVRWRWGTLYAGQMTVIAVKGNAATPGTPS